MGMKLTGPSGGGGLSGVDSAHEVRHDFVSPNDYMGVAPAGSATSASVWTITSLAISPAGATTVTHATGVKWDDRLSATYT